MARRVSFSEETLTITEAGLYHRDSFDALKLFFSAAAPAYVTRFAGYKPDEVRSELGDRLAELDRNTTMSVLAAVEAAFRVDYLQRCHLKKKDDISRQFQDLYRKKRARASLEDDIFEIWKTHTTGSARLIGDLRAAFRFRHWMAHGRYWSPKLGRKYDFFSVYPLAVQAVSSFPLLRP